MEPIDRALASRYGIAVFGFALALLSRLLLDSLGGHHVPLLAFSLAVVAVAWYGGFGPSFLTLLLSEGAFIILLARPDHSLAATLVEHRLQICGFLFLGVAIGLFSEALRKARQRAEAHAREGERQRQELEQEIVQRQRLEEELQRRADQLAETDRRKDEFLAMLGHELRNPLAPIRNAVHVLRLLGPADAKVQWAREVIERQVDQMVRLVDDLLDVSRINRGKIILRSAPVLLSEVIERAVEVSRPLLEAHKHHWTVVLPREPVWLQADSLRLAQAVANLLNNAGKYTPENGRIRLTVERQEKSLLLRVKDNGIGIAPEMLPRVFDLFAQAEQSRDRSEGGLGIGLTLVKSLVELHGGRIEAFSAGPGQGSEFVVHLPLVPVQPDRPTLPPVAEPIKKTRRILAVDDNTDAAESLALLLRLQGHEVRIAHDGLTALQEAEAFRPEVVLMDLDLPQMDGYEVARRLRSQEGLKHTFLVALTGFGRSTDRQRVQEAGFDAHLINPADPATLAQVVAGNRG